MQAVNAPASTRREAACRLTRGQQHNRLYRHGRQQVDRRKGSHLIKGKAARYEMVRAKMYGSSSTRWNGEHAAARGSTIHGFKLQWSGHVQMH